MSFITSRKGSLLLAALLVLTLLVYLLFHLLAPRVAEHRRRLCARRFHPGRAESRRLRPGRSGRGQPAGQGRPVARPPRRPRLPHRPGRRRSRRARCRGQPGQCRGQPATPAGADRTGAGQGPRRAGRAGLRPSRAKPLPDPRQQGRRQPAERPAGAIADRYRQRPAGRGPGRGGCHAQAGERPRSPRRPGPWRPATHAGATRPGPPGPLLLRTPRPFDGQVGRRQLRVGAYVTPGSALLAVVPCSRPTWSAISRKPN